MAKQNADKNQQPRQSVQVALQSTNVAFKLTPRQQSVYDALQGKTAPCAKMYIGAMMVLADQNNPERLFLAAHSLRELMNSIGPHLNVPVLNPGLKKGQGNLNDKFINIEKRLLRAEKININWDGEKWSGTIHKYTSALLIEIQGCVKWRALNEKLRKTKSDAILNSFDPLHNALPKEIQSMHISEWEKTRDYFVRVAHHAATEPQQLDSWLLHLEEMLLKGLTPRAEQSLAEMDAIIKAGEGK